MREGGSGCEVVGISTLRRIVPWFSQWWLATPTYIYYYRANNHPAILFSRLFE